MQKRVIFPNKILPYALLAPQIAITVLFFFLPAGQAIWQSLLMQDAFGLRVEFVWFENFARILKDPNYLAAIKTTIVFSSAVTFLAMAPALLLALMADRQIRAADTFKTLIVWPYAVAPAVAAVLWLFMFHPSIGVVGQLLIQMGVKWNYALDGNQAMLLVILASAWKQVSYNFLFFLAGLQSIPKSILEAASIDGASARTRFWTVIFPLLSPTTFFLLVVNVVYAFFDTFGTIDALTKGGPGTSTVTLIYRVYVDGNNNLNFGASAAQSVILMAVVIALTAVQFRYIERKVHY
jgi:sn-glycerol 3-phosphate transport system permease protein